MVKSLVMKCQTCEPGIILNSCRYYGCGVISPDDLEGLAVLDLGCGAGMDCFVLSKLVGLAGFVTGVDCTEEQVSDILKITRDHFFHFFSDFYELWHSVMSICLLTEVKQQWAALVLAWVTV